nr:hypothetical protein [Xanthomonas albilineans]
MPSIASKSALDMQEATFFQLFQNALHRSLRRTALFGDEPHARPALPDLIGRISQGHQDQL